MGKLERRKNEKINFYNLIFSTFIIFNFYNFRNNVVSKTCHFSKQSLAFVISSLYSFRPGHVPTVTVLRDKYARTQINWKECTGNNFL